MSLPSTLRVSLVFPPFDDKRDRSVYFLAPPLGLLYLASYLEHSGHQVAVHDFILDLKAGRLQAGRDLYEQCAVRILETQPDLVGLSTQCTTTPGTINIARCIKRLRPSLPIVLGGYDVSFLPARFLTTFGDY